MLTRWALAAGLIALIALGGWGYARDRAADRWQERAAQAERQASVANQMLEQARLARRIADEEAARQRKRAAEFDQLRAELLNGDQDADLPDWLRDYVARLLRRPAR